MHIEITKNRGCVIKYCLLKRDYKELIDVNIKCDKRLDSKVIFDHSKQLSNFEALA